MNSFLLTVAGFVIAALTLAFAVPLFIDWNSYRHVFEAQASKMVGRNVFVGGDVRLRLLPTPLLRFSEVRIADSKGQIDTPFAQAQSFTVWLSAPPLLRGTLQARQIEIERPIINVHLTADGKASWFDMGPADGELAFVPREVELDSVKLNDATIAIYRNPTSGPIKIENLTGELTAKNLDGPYKFAGNFRYEGVERNIKLSTVRRHEDGSLRLKSVMRDAAGTENVVAEGILKGLPEAPRFEGRIFGQYGAALGSVGLISGAGDGAQAPVEIRSKLAVGLDKAQLDEIEVTIRNNDKPQILKGSLAIAWLDGLEVNGEITSRWFDFDGLARRGKDAPRSLGKTFKGLLDEAARLAGHVQRGHLHVAIDQAGLAGDVVSGLEAELELNGPDLGITGLSLNLPGSNRMDIAGVASPNGKGAKFDGTVRLKGKNFIPLLKWSGFEHEHLASAGESAISLEATLQTGGERLVLENARGELLGSSFNAALRYQWGASPKFALDLASERLDFTRIFGRYATMATLIKLANVGADSSRDVTQGPAVTAGGASLWLKAGDARVDLSVGSAKLPGLDDANLAVKFSLAGGDFAIERLTLRSANGLVMRAEGGLTDLDEQPKGRILLTADAAKPAGIEALWSILELPAKDIVAARIDAMAPMRIAIAIESKKDQENGLEARVGGAFDKSNIEFLASYTGDLANLNEGQFDLSGTLSNGDGGALVHQLFPNLNADSIEPFRGRHGQVMVKAGGETGGAAKILTRLDVGDFHWEIDGSSNHDEHGRTFEGRSALRTNDVGQALALAGLRSGPRAQSITVDLASPLMVAGPSYHLNGLTGTIGASKLTGSVKIDGSWERPSFDAVLETDDASLPQILRPLLAWGRGNRRQVRRSSANRSQAAPVRMQWAKRRFDTDLIASLKGSFALKTKRLGVTGALVLSDAELHGVLDEGKIDVSKLAGGWAQGEAEISAKLERRAEGVAVTGEVTVKHANLQQLSGLASTPLASGTADLKLSLSGVGLTPKGLAAAMNGSGTLTFSGGSIRGISPAGLAALAQSEVVAETSKTRTLPGRVAAQFQAASFEAEPVTIALEVRDGVAQFENAILNGASGEVTVTSYLELATMKLDSEWRLAAGPREAANEDLQVTLVFAGPIADLGHMTPKIETKALNRYITVGRLARELEMRQLAQAAQAAKAAKAAEAARVVAEAKAAEAAKAAEEAAANKAADAVEAAEAAKVAEAARVAAVAMAAEKAQAARAARVAVEARALEAAKTVKMTEPDVALPDRRPARPVVAVPGVPSPQAAGTSAASTAAAPATDGPPPSTTTASDSWDAPLPWRASTQIEPSAPQEALPPGQRADGDEPTPEQRTSRRPGRQRLKEGDFSVFSN